MDTQCLDGIHCAGHNKPCVVHVKYNVNLILNEMTELLSPHHPVCSMSLHFQNNQVWMKYRAKSYKRSSVP